MFKRRREHRQTMRYLLTGERGWKRFEATIIAARTAADMADGEAALLAECTLSGRSVEFLAASGVDGVRIYRVGESA